MTLAVYSFAFRAMASRCEVRVFAPDEAAARQWSDAGIAEVRRIEEKYSRYRDDSVTSALNRSAGGAGLSVDEETAALLNFGARLHEQSEGAFDLTSGVLRRAWDFKSARLPQAQDIEGLLPLVGWQRIEWDGRQLRLPLPGMEIDFGGIGKEYAVDRVADWAAAHADCPVLVNFGGDLRATGPAPANGAWIVGIDSPLAPGAAVRRIELKTGAVATSGDAARFVELDGKRYGHILDARTGWPPAGAPRSVTVVASTCSEAGSYSTLAMLSGAGAAAFLQNESVQHWLL